MAEVFSALFYKWHSRSGTAYRKSSYYYTVDTVALYDFLYDHDYSAWLCNKARGIKSYSDTRPLIDFIMRLHTGETQYHTTQNWSSEERERLGQRYLVDLAEDVLNYWNADCSDGRKKESSEPVETLLRCLELDGYVYENERLLTPEEDILDVQEQVGVLESLYTSLRLNNKETAIHHLQLSEEHYLAERWDDSIANSRKFLECVLQEVAAVHSLRVSGSPLPDATYTRPVRVRDYLEREGLFETKEKQAVAAVYGLLSHTGGHPYMAQSDQARLLRHLALTLSQFAMLRLRGSLV